MTDYSRDWTNVFPDCVSASGQVKRGLTSEQKTKVYVYKARQIHGDKYDYSKFVFSSTKNKSVIICPHHGEFLVAPTNHINNKSGCSECVGNKTSDTESFVSKARLKHGNTYDYSLVEYVNATTKVKLVCNTHGEFLQSPANHLSGAKCFNCAGSVSKTTAEFISDANTVHGPLYNYSKVKYITGNEKVEIVCKTHGGFLQKPYKHLEGQGCPRCIERRESTHVYLLDYGTGVFKIGITIDLYGQRLPKLKREFGNRIDVIGYWKVGDPTKIERYLLDKYTCNPCLNGRVFDGYTELRVLTPEQVQEIVTYMETL